MEGVEDDDDDDKKHSGISWEKFVDINLPRNDKKGWVSKLKFVFGLH